MRRIRKQLTSWLRALAEIIDPTTTETPEGPMSRYERQSDNRNANRVDLSLME